MFAFAFRALVWFGSGFWKQSRSVTQTDLELLNLLPQPPQRWQHQHVLPLPQPILINLTPLLYEGLLPPKDDDLGRCWLHKPSSLEGKLQTQKSS